MEPFVKSGISGPLPYMYVDNAKSYENPVNLFKAVVVMMEFMAKHCSSNNSIENIERYTNDVKFIIDLHQKLSKKHIGMGKDLIDMENRLHEVLKNMEKDVRKSERQDSSEYLPSSKKFKSGSEVERLNLMGKNPYLPL